MQLHFSVHILLGFVVLQRYLVCGYPTHLIGSDRKYSHKDYTHFKVIHHLNEYLDIGLPSSCTLCKGLVAVLHGVAETDLGLGEVIKFAKFVCDEFKIYDQRICEVGVHEWGQELWGVFANGVVEPDILCGLFLGDSCAHIPVPFHSWNISIPARTEPLHHQDIDAPTKRDGAPVSTVLHITDIHLDYEYEEGAKVDCGEPLCCRRSDGMAGRNETAAPKWAYAGYCDTSLGLMENLLQHLNQTVGSKLDYIIWTGDVPPHNVWNQSKADQIDKLDRAVGLLKKWLPNTPVYPALGNHESSPVNSFPPPSITDQNNNQWLLDQLAKDWGNWLPAETMDTIKKGGFYTVLVHKGFRIVSLNMNYMNPDNWWLFVDSVDPAGQLNWLVDVLLKAEMNNEKVHIIGHIPPPHGLKWWSYNFYRVVDRFYDTIAAQFYGHTHNDHFYIFYDMKTWKNPNNIAYVGPSVTTYHHLYPGYRIYDIEGDFANTSKAVLDHHTYIFNLTKVGQTGDAVWDHEYSAKDLYGMSSLSPAAWDDLVSRMMKDDDLFQKFYRYYTKGAPQDACDDQCKKQYLCDAKTALAGGSEYFCNSQFGDFDHKGVLPFLQSKIFGNC